jgi:hypothetical protein
MAPKDSVLSSSSVNRPHADRGVGNLGQVHDEAMV